MTDLEAVITAAMETEAELNRQYEDALAQQDGNPTDVIAMAYAAALHVAKKREALFLAKLRELQRGIYG